MIASLRNFPGRAQAAFKSVQTQQLLQRGDSGVNLLLILVSIGLSITGQVLLKVGATTPVHAPGDLLSNLLRPHTLIALTMYAASGLLWISVLSRNELSYAYPLLGLNYAVIVGISAWLLHEPISIHRWVGVLIIAVGFLVTATS